ncbi:MAG: rhodanese-like domain-containing protein [Verrucomicrobiota bacterium]
MTPPPAPPPETPSASNARLWLQAACIFAAAVACGVIYNGASPLGLRPQALPLASAALGGVAEKTTAAQKGFSNETVSMTLEIAPGKIAPPRGNPPTPAAGTPPSQIPSLTWAQVQTLMAAQKVVVVDARTKVAFDLGHIPGAVLMPANASVPELQAFATQYPKDTPLVVYCSSTTCHSSDNVVKQLVNVAGFKNVSLMPGGFAEYTLAQTPSPPTKP